MNRPWQKTLCCRGRRRFSGCGPVLFAASCSLSLLLAHGPAALAEPPAAAAPDPAPNPPAAGFNLAGSDAKAVALADATMAAMGGRAAWDHTRYLTWRFFGERLHIWDRFTGRERIESTDRKTGQKKVVLMNLNTKQGQVFIDGKEVTAAPQRAAALQDGLEAWINDSYWLLMPYKLKDSGVTLQYKGVADLADGRSADVLVLTFAGVGVTPQNKYLVYIAKDSGLVAQWTYFEKSTAAKPDMQTPWLDWRRYGRILLSGDRGKEGSLTDLAVLDTVPDEVFSQPAPVDLTKLIASAAKPGPGPAALKLRDFAGHPVVFSQVQRDATLLAFWSASCVPCIEEMPLIEALHKQLSADSQVAVIGINVDDASELPAAQKVLAAHKLTYPMLRDAQHELVHQWFPDKSDDLPLPTLLVTDRQLHALYTQGFQPGTTPESFIAAWTPRLTDARTGKLHEHLKLIAPTKSGPMDPAKMAPMIEKLVRSHHPELSFADVKKRVAAALVQLRTTGKFAVE